MVCKASAYSITWSRVTSVQDVMAHEQIVRAEGHKLPLLAAHPTFHHQAHRSREVIVADAGGHASKVFEGADMAVEESLLLLAGKGHHKAPPAVGQPHDKDLHGLPDPADHVDDSIAKVV